jgi:predicted P-loop ATPase
VSLHAGQSPPQEKAPTAGKAAGAEEHSGQTERADSRSDWDERKGGGGSFEFDDSDRPRWDRQTVLEREHDYHHANGAYAYTVLKGRRSDGEKVFLQGRRVSGHSDLAEAQQAGETYRFPNVDHYRKGTGDEPDLLYRLPDLLKAMAERPDDPVLICEGEKDVDRLWDQGLIATTNAKGALNWKPEFNAVLAGRNVVILTDNDSKGRKRTAKLLPMLASVAASVKALELPDLPECGDVSDWLDAGNTVEDLLALIAAQPSTVPAEWAATHGEFATDKHGKPYPSPENARTALSKMGVEVAYDEFAGRYLLNGLTGFGPVLDDAALTRLRLLTEERWHLAFGKDRWWDIVTDHARRNTFHPVRQYLDGLEWDGKERVGSWLIEYAKAEDNEYVRTVGALVLVAAVRRVRNPGCKFDEMLVLESSQGTGKSTALAILAVRDDWFADDLPLDSDSKVVMERTAGRWLVELAELKGMRRGAVEHVKAMVSRQIDKARPAYGRMAVEQARQCVFFGTTNDGAYLRDMTGNRRFWPVKIGRFDLGALRRDCDQLWAEAAAREAEGVSIRLPERLWSVAGAEQEGREVVDPIYETLSERLDGQSGKVRASDIWEVIGLGDQARRTQDHNMRVSSAMQRLGWHRPKSKLRFGGAPQHAWVKGQEGVEVTALPEVPRDALFPSQQHGDDGRPM